MIKRVGQIRPQATLPILQCVNFAVFALGGYDLQSPTISLIFVVERNFTNQSKVIWTHFKNMYSFDIVDSLVYEQIPFKVMHKDFFAEYINVFYGCDTW